MRNGISTPIRIAIIEAGRGLLEDALQREGSKGCSEILCTAPVALEPPYVPFDGPAILGRVPAPAEGGVAVEDADMVTLEFYSGEEDIVNPDWVEFFLRATSVFPSRLAFELVGSRGRVAFRFAVERQYLSGFLAAITGVFPALRLREIASPFPSASRSGTLFVEEYVPPAPYARTVSLIGKDGISHLAIAYRALEKCQGEECAVYQVLAQPALPEHNWYYNVKAFHEAERRAAESDWMGGFSERLSYEPGVPSRLEPAADKAVERDGAPYALVCRVAIWATPPRQTEFAQEMQAAMGTLRFGNRPFRVITSKLFLDVLGPEGTHLMVSRRRTHRPGRIMTSGEVVTFVHPPHAWALEMFPSIERRKGIEWRDPGVEAKPSGDVVLGTNTYAGKSIPVVVPVEVRLRHTAIVGIPGYGKSCLIDSMASSDSASEQGVLLVDPHSDLCHSVLASIPETRIKDVVCVSFAHRDYAPRWNMFASGVPPDKLADDIARSLLGSGEVQGARMGNVMRHAAYATAVLGGCLADFADLISRTEKGNSMRRDLVQRLTNREARRFWTEEFPAFRDEQLESTRNKVSRLLLHETLGAMFSQRENTLNPREWMDQRKIVIVNIASGVLGPDFARFVAGVLISLCHRAAVSRADVPPERRVPFFIFADEAPLLQTGALAEMVAQERKFKVGIALAYQNLAQLDPPVAHAVGNCSVKVVFRPAEEDLGHARRMLMGRVTERDLASLGVGEAFALVGNRVTSLRTAFRGGSALRDGAALERRLVEETYLALDSHETEKTTLSEGAPPRIYDSFGGPGRGR